MKSAFDLLDVEGAPIFVPGALMCAPWSQGKGRLNLEDGCCWVLFL